VAIEVSLCVVNTELRDVLLTGLDAIGRERATVDFSTEVIVLDNASRDGSAEAARAHPAVDEVIALSERRSWSANVNTVAAASRGRFVLLLNEDAELRPGALAALHVALEYAPRAGVAAARLERPDGRRQPSAWRFPTPWTALLTALQLHRRFVVQSTGDATRPVDWAQSCTILIRREAADAAGWWDEAFFVYSEEVDFQRRLRDRGWGVLYVPGAVSVHHEQLSTGGVPHRRIVEFSRNRDRYMRKHHSAAAALAVRWLTAATYALRAAAALVLPGHDPRRYWRHATATLFPSRGEGMAEAAERFNSGSGRELGA
jgi:N-acetylglucosaminyl-diphospho-decaprenol L-rhamnosyltransferase